MTVRLYGEQVPEPSGAGLFAIGLATSVIPARNLVVRSHSFGNDLRALVKSNLTYFDDCALLLDG